MPQNPENITENAVESATKDTTENIAGNTTEPLIQPTPEHENRERDLKLGASILAAAGFQDRQKDIVDSSFDKARKNDEKLPGKNSERRNFAYLSRLSLETKEKMRQLISETKLDLSYASGNHDFSSLRLYPYLATRS